MPIKGRPLSVQCTTFIDSNKSIRIFFRNLRSMQMYGQFWFKTPFEKGFSDVKVERRGILGYLNDSYSYISIAQSYSLAKL